MPATTPSNRYRLRAQMSAVGGGRAGSWLGAGGNTGGARGPKRTEHAQLNFIRLPAQPLDDEIVLIPAQRDDVEGGLVCGHVLRIRGARRRWKRCSWRRRRVTVRGQ